jgi:hypothetical protein
MFIPFVVIKIIFVFCPARGNMLVVENDVVKITRPARDGMLVENNVINHPHPVGMQCW